MYIDVDSKTYHCSYLSMNFCSKVRKLRVRKALDLMAMVIPEKLFSWKKKLPRAINDCEICYLLSMKTLAVFRIAYCLL